MSAIVGALADKVAETSTIAKKQKTGHVYPVISILYSKLLEIRLAIGAKRTGAGDSILKEVEVEVRVGMITESSSRWKARTSGRDATIVDDISRSSRNLLFKAGIDEIFNNSLQKKLSSSPIFQCTKQPLQILRFDNEGNRWEIDSNGVDIPISVEKKDNFFRRDIALLSYDYDIRMDGALEIQKSSSDSSSILPNSRKAWVKERRKRRFTYIKKDGIQPWKIDLTFVESRDNSPSTKIQKDIELEFELLEDIKQQWLRETVDEKATAMSKFIAEQLLQLIDFCIPFESEPASSESLQAVRDPIYSRSIQALNAMILSQDEASSSRIDFIGSMPVNLTRQNLQTILSKDYFMTEKSDGVRYLLYVVPDPISRDPVAVLLDRAKTVYSFRGSGEVGRALGLHTVLDGELVFNLKHKEHAFLVFDLLFWRGESQFRKPFGERLNLLQTTVLRHYSTEIVKIPTKIRPLILVRKVFVRKSEGLRVLLDKIRSEPNGDRIYSDSDRRVHRTDGIIFQPNEPYQVSRHPGLMKWKWADLRSVDLAVSTYQQPDLSLVLSGLSCGGPDNTLIKCGSVGGPPADGSEGGGVSIGAFDCLRLLSEIREHVSGGKVAIVEVAYDVSVGMWSYIHHRKDKTVPNYIDTVMGVFVEQAEAISVEELEFSLTASEHDRDSSQGDFQTLLAQQAKKLIETQRERILVKTSKK